MEEPMFQRQLFGGAFQLSIPQRMVDISDFRTVPDNQEVFADANTDQSLIIEIVEHVENVSNVEAGSFFFNDLASVNEAAQSAITSCTELRSDVLPGLPEGSYCCIVQGQQAVGKSRQGNEALNKLHVIVLIIRLPRYDSDILMTMNTPIYIHEASSAAQHVGAGYKDSHVTAPQLFQRMMETFRIVDWNIFGGTRDPHDKES